jgi:ribose 1,5-bisphosphokinase
MNQEYLINKPKTGGFANAQSPGGDFISGVRSGTLVYVMGRSGAGKDSIIAAAGQTVLRWVVTAHRYIRVRRGWDDLYLEPEEFNRLDVKKAWALHWSAHGHEYGISKLLDKQLLDGLAVIVNGSGGYLEEDVRLCPDLVPVLVTAFPLVLKERLEKRGLE